MNEAEVRSNIIDPLLATLGLDYDNISLERSFTIKIGKYNEEIQWERHSRHPRYDYLIKADDKNLFIIEAKKQGSHLSEDDLEQGICYAKLVDPIAPFVVLTNGSETKVYETLTKKDITNIRLSETEYAKNNYAIDLDPEIKQLALLALFSLNYSTFVDFCVKQSSDTISQLSESADEIGILKRYIPEIFVKRHDLENSLHNFIRSESSCFMISGKSGIGKTNVMCDFVKDIQKRFPVLFYNGGQISDKLENEIANDLNWEFATDKPPQRMFKQIDDICKKHGQPLLIFLDAVDEWKMKSAPIDVNKFIGYVLDKNIKLIVSCKDSKLREFLAISGTVSALSQNIYAAPKTLEKSFVLSEFLPDERIEAVNNYSKHFMMTGITTTSETFSACSDPIILRVIAEVYRDNLVPSSLNSAQIWQKYLDVLSSKKPSLRADIRKTLTEVAAVMLEQENDTICESLMKNVNTESFAFLMDYGVLINKPDNVGRYSVTFSIDGLRNYIMVYHILQLDQLPISDFEDQVSKHIDSRLGYELFRWLMDAVSDKRKEILQDRITCSDKKLFSQYLRRFTVKTESQFPFIKKRLYPNGKLGLLVLYNKKTNRPIKFGFRKYDEPGEQIVWKDMTHKEVQDDVIRRLMNQYGVSRLSWFSRDLTNSPLDEFVETQISAIVEEILERRCLDERNNVKISLEKFFASLRSWGDFLDVPVTYEIENDILPLNMNDLKNKILQRFPNHATDIYYNVKISPDDFIVLLDSFENLYRRSDTITATALPHCDDLGYPSNYVIPSEKYFTKKGLLHYVTEFLKGFVDEYKSLVETNFPTLKNKFDIYQKFPVYVIAQITKHNSEKGDGLTYAICKNDESKNEFEIRNYDDEEICINRLGNDSRGFGIKTKKGVKQTHSYHSMVIFTLFQSTNSEFPGCPLTDYVYEQIKEDLDKIFNSENVMR